MKFTRFSVALLVLGGGLAALAQANPAPDRSVTTTTTTSTTPEKKPAPLPADAVTEGTVTLEGGRTLGYRAVAGMLTVGASDAQDATLGLDGKYLPEAPMELPAKPEDQPATARMFYTAYFAKDGARDASAPDNGGTRPVVFFYNGGPGSATMYLRMASLGPVRVQLPDLQHPVGGPYKVGPNPYSLLDAADLVFIDAPGTGYSRVQGKDGAKAFNRNDQDPAAFDPFISRLLP